MTDTFHARFLRAGTGNEFADYLLGYAGQDAAPGRFDARGHALHLPGLLLAQDDWKITSRLTLNPGIRYEANTPLADEYGRNTMSIGIMFGAGAATVIVGQVGPVTGNRYNDAMYESDWNDSGATRGRFASRPSRATPQSCAAAMAVFMRFWSGQIFTFQAQNPPRIINDVFTATFPNPTLTCENGFQLNDVNPAGLSPCAASSSTVAIPAYGDGISRSSASLRETSAIELAYVATSESTASHRLHQQSATRSGSNSAPAPVPGICHADRTRGSMVSIYDAFQFKADKRFSQGHSFLLSYTFGKSIDTGSASFGGGGDTSSDNAQDSNNIRAERGRSAQDVKRECRAELFVQLPFGRGRRFA